ncbi:MAG: hypothetical protein WA687_10635 [Solirubrobacterales bacterium]
MICATVLAGYGGILERHATSILTESEAKEALRQLPYRYRFRPVDLPEGAEAAIAGTAFGSYKTVLHFGVAFGRSVQGVPVPRAGTSENIGYQDTFIFTDDLAILNAKGKKIMNPQFNTAKRWREAVEMEVQMTEKLCKAASGEGCGV